MNDILLTIEDIKDNIAIIKVNRKYNPIMTTEEKYEVVRGFWKRKIESVIDAKYCLAVYNQIVFEVYEIDRWYPAGTIMMNHRKYDKAELIGRIEFSGRIAPSEVRERYIGKNVSNLYKRGEANPVKIIKVD